MDLNKEIYKTLSWFDMFDYPLTTMELWRFLGVKCSISELRLPTPPRLRPGYPSKEGIHIESGFYFLAGREEIIQTRMRRYNHTDRKFKRAIFVARVFRFIPWIRLICVANLQGAHNMRDEGDIDLFIVTEKKKIYSVRLLTVGLTMFMGLRPGRKTKDKICLSFFISDDALNLDSLKLTGSDPYFDHWLLGLTPIFDLGGVYEKFIQENRKILNNFPNWRPIEPAFHRILRPRFCLIASLIRILFFWLEPVAKLIQNITFSSTIRALKNIDTRVVVNDKVLKLYPNDRRLEYREKFIKYLDPTPPLPLKEGEGD